MQHKLILTSCIIVIIVKTIKEAYIEALIYV